MIELIQSPAVKTFEDFNKFYYDTNKLFLGGGISNCPDWQHYISLKFKRYDGDLMVFNPRRVGDLAPVGSEARTQILWEHLYLMQSSAILFWFPCETVCPITLFELGVWATRYKDTPENLIIGAHPDYSRKFDLEVQLELINPRIKIHYNLDSLFQGVVSRFDLKEK